MITAKDSLRVIAAYFIFILGVFVALTCLFAGVAIFVNFSDANLFKVILSGIGLIIASLAFAIVSFVGFKSLRAQVSQNE